ncbi:MAG: DUF4878 domain-containing protein [Ruminococcaceae bacterium]|nr:DUF4878 domain-containing protein [Oscillospiraceae bacterium]
MKRILAILLLASMMLVMASCGASGPEKTVEKYVESILDYDFKKASKYVAVDYKDMFEMMIAQRMEEGEISKKEVYEELSEELDADIKSYNDYIKYLKKTAKESMEEEFDGKYDIEVSVVASEILEEDAKYAALKSASATYDSSKIILSEEINLAKVKECRKVTVKAYFYEDKSDVFSYAQSLEVTVVKIGSKWIILDGGMGMMG